MSFASHGENRIKENANLLKKKRFFDFHQNTIQKFFNKGDKRKLNHKKLSDQELALIRKELEAEKRNIWGKKYFLLVVSFVLTLIVLFLIAFIFTEYVF